jgi:hypothetical protein
MRENFPRTGKKARLAACDGAQKFTRGKNPVNKSVKAPKYFRTTKYFVEKFPRGNNARSNTTMCSHELISA